MTVSTVITFLRCHSSSTFFSYYDHLESLFQRPQQVCPCFLHFVPSPSSMIAAFGILVRRCFAFDDSDTSLQLVDDRGCVTEKLISSFEYDQEKGTAEATIYSMFR